jgi:hypothetical protein
LIFVSFERFMMRGEMNVSGMQGLWRGYCTTSKRN